MPDLAGRSDLPLEDFLYVFKAAGNTADERNGQDRLIGKNGRIWVGKLSDPCGRQFVLSQAARFQIDPRFFWNKELVKAIDSA